MRRILLVALFFLASILAVTELAAQTPAGTAFTYQGRLTDMGTPAATTYDMQFKLFDVVTSGSGTQFGLTVSIPAVQVTGGLFTVPLDFGAGAFDGSQRFLDIGIKPAGGMSYTPLSPRQELTPTPYSQTIFSRTVVVKPLGATAAANGTLLTNALAGITTASATNPWLVRIEPGVYALGSASLVMKPYVDIEGSGEDVTKITSATNLNTTGTITGASNSEIRFLTIESAGGTTSSTAFYSSGASPRLLHVTLLASGSSQANGAILSGGSPLLQNVTVNCSAATPFQAIGMTFQSSTTAVVVDSTVTATGIMGVTEGFLVSTGAAPRIERSRTIVTGTSGSIHGTNLAPGTSVSLLDSTITASGTGSIGLLFTAGAPGSSAIVSGSRLSGVAYSIFVQSGHSASVALTQLSGTVMNSGGTLACVGSYNAAFGSLNAACN